MITEVELVDFLSHGNTTVKFGTGMNVIVGSNGAGKSSVVDAITFALFGKHTRRVNRSLVRHGATSGYAKVVFEADGRRLEATRKLKGGTATPVLREWSGGEWVNIAAGERRQMAESTTREIESILGMNFESMQIASIIRQGELSAIVHESPKDFKLRINDIIRINDMDEAEGHMADLLSRFRDSIRERRGHDDTQLGAIRSRLEEGRAGLGAAEGEVRALRAERSEEAARAATLEGELEAAEEAARAAADLESRKRELGAYAQQRGAEAAEEAAKIEADAAECRRRLAECEAAGGSAGNPDALRGRISGLEGELEAAREAARAAADLESRKRELGAYAQQRGAEAAEEAAKIEADAAECRQRLAECEAAGGSGAEGADGLRARVAGLEAERDRAGAAERAAADLESRKRELGAYAQQRGAEAAEEAGRIETEAAECRVLLETARTAAERRRDLQAAREEANSAARAVAEGEKRIAALTEQLDISGKLVLKDGKCPVCNSAVKRLNPIYDREHIEGDLEAIRGEIEEHRRAASESSARVDEIAEAEGRAREAESALEARGVSGRADIDAMQERAAGLARVSGMAEACARGDWGAAAGIDAQARAHCEAIAGLEGKASETAGRSAEEVEREIATVRRAAEAVAFLAAQSVAGAADIEAMGGRAAGLRDVEAMAGACARGDWGAAAGIDAQARAHCEAIAGLEGKASETAGRSAEEVEREIATVRRAAEAAAFLAAQSVAGAADIEAMGGRAAGLRDVEAMAGACARGDWGAAAGIDAQARAHCEAIAGLIEAAGAEGRAVAEVRAELEAARASLDAISKRHGAAEERARALAAEIERDAGLASELEIVYEYVARLDAIRGAFKRDGPVATSLRSWALDRISRASTDHLALLGTRIGRISLSEKGRNVTISCHDGVTTSEVDSLSGGEQVCVALALRLGMASLLGAGGPSYVILDEPTAHLDEERRRALAQVLTNLAGTSEGGTPMQFIMITHDSEIFGEAPVERCYRFDSGRRGTEVSELRAG